MRHESVADEFVERAAVGEDDPHHAVEVFVELIDERDGIGGALGERREAAHIGEKNGDDFALAAERMEDALALIEQLVRDVARRRSARAAAASGAARWLRRLPRRRNTHRRRDSSASSGAMMGRKTLGRLKAASTTSSSTALRPTTRSTSKSGRGAKSAPSQAMKPIATMIDRVHPARRLAEEGILQQRVHRVEVNLRTGHLAERRLDARPAATSPDGPMTTILPRTRSPPPKFCAQYFGTKI